MQGIYFLITLLIIFIIDFIWLNLISKKFYMREFSKIAKKEKGSLKPRLIPAILVYLIIALGINLFVIPFSKTILDSLIYGALFGFILYGVYDLTNLSILKNYSTKLTIVDILWGTFLLGTVSFLIKLISTIL